MFRWYHNAAVCYVYLSDVPISSAAADMASSRWFTRGWTLQELIAPKEVQFFSSEWKFIDTKANMRDIIFGITNIDPSILTGGDLESISVARRMSWASQRKTSRIEDMAYALLGIFDVNLPLIYGEGRKAFQRLQEAIMLKTHDQSLFAWGEPATEASGLVSDDQYFGLEPIQWKPPEDRQPLLGLFAESPKLFQFSGNIEPGHRFSHELRRDNPPRLVSGGVLLGLVSTYALYSVTQVDRPALALPTPAGIAVLLCRFGPSEDRLVCLILRQWGDGYWGRTPEFLVLKVEVKTEFFRSLVREMHVLPERPLNFQHGDIVFRRHFTATTFQKDSIHKSTTLLGHPAWRRVYWGDSCLLVRLAHDATGHEDFGYVYRINARRSISILFRRLPRHGMLGPLRVRVLPSALDELPENETDPHEQQALAYADFVAQVHSHIMRVPCDSWVLENDAYPRIYIGVERHTLGTMGGGGIDVVDLFIYPEGPDADRAKKALMALECEAKSTEPG
jgi:hypothetical protein